MAVPIPLQADRVKETSTTTGTGTLNLDGASTGFQTFVAGIGTTKECYYVIAHQTLTEWEVGIGTVTDAAPDTLSRDTILRSSNSDAAVSLSVGTKDVFVSDPFDFLIANGLQNLVINPEMHIMPGTHTSGIQQNNAASTTQNHEIPGWRSVTGTGSPDITVSGDTTAGTFVSGAKRSIKVVVTVLGTSDPFIEIPYIEGEANSIDAMLYGMRNRVLNFSADVKQSAATASACRLAITTDGTGGTTTFGAFHGTNTNIERLFVSASIPNDATIVRLRLSIENATPDFNLSRPMGIVTDVALKSLLFKPRPGININGLNIDGSTTLAYTTPADTNFHVSGDGTADTDPSGGFNGVRPTWANSFTFFFDVSGTVVGPGFLKPNGDTNSFIQANSQNTNAFGGEMFATVPFGVDSEYQFKVDDTGLDLFIFGRQYFGEGL